MATGGEASSKDDETATDDANETNGEQNETTDGKTVVNNDVALFTMTEEEFENLGKAHLHPSSHLFPPENTQIETMRRQYLYGCRQLNVVPAQQVVQCLGNRTLCLHHKGLGERGVLALVAAIKKNPQIRSLDLCGNFIGVKGITSLCDFLTINECITFIDLSDNFLRRQGGLIAVRTLATCLKLETINLAGNKLDDPVGIELAEAFLGHPSLQYLNLSRNCLDEATAQAFADGLLSSLKLVELDLSTNCLRGKGLVALIRSLRNNHTLQKLYLASNGLADKGADALGAMLTHNKTLTFVDISDNRIPVKSSKSLAAGLSINKFVSHFMMGKNPLQTKGLQVILDAISRVDETSLHVLDCNSLTLSSELNDVLDSVMIHHPDLTVTFGPRGPIFHGRTTRQRAKDSIRSSVLEGLEEFFHSGGFRGFSLDMLSSDEENESKDENYELEN